MKAIWTRDVFFCELLWISLCFKYMWLMRDHNILSLESIGHLLDSWCITEQWCSVMRQWNQSVCLPETRTLKCISHSLKLTDRTKHTVMYGLAVFSTTSVWLMGFRTGELVQCDTSFCLCVSSPSSSWQPPESPSLCNQLPLADAPGWADVIWADSTVITHAN